MGSTSGMAVVENRLRDRVTQLEIFDWPQFAHNLLVDCQGDEGVRCQDPATLIH